MTDALQMLSQEVRAATDALTRDYLVRRSADPQVLADPVADTVMVVDRAHLMPVMVRTGAGGDGREGGEGGGRDGEGDELFHDGHS